MSDASAAPSGESITIPSDVVEAGASVLQSSDYGAEVRFETNESLVARIYQAMEQAMPPMPQIHPKNREDSFGGLRNGGPGSMPALSEIPKNPCLPEPESALGRSIAQGLLDRLRFGAEVIARFRSGETIESAVKNTQGSAPEFATDEPLIRFHDLSSLSPFSKFPHD